MLDKIEKLNEEQVYIAKLVIYEYFVKESVIEYIKLNEEARFSLETSETIKEIMKYNEKTKEKESVIYKSVVENKDKIDNILNNKERE